jgi:hypothetical protein
VNPVNEPNFSPVGTDAGTLLGWLAWLFTVAGVVGLIIVGMQFVLQLRRGEPGEMSAYARSFLVVLVACVVASSAGPVVNWLGDFALK